MAARITDTCRAERSCASADVAHFDVKTQDRTFGENALALTALMEDGFAVRLMIPRALGRRRVSAICIRDPFRRQRLAMPRAARIASSWAMRDRDEGYHFYITDATCRCDDIEHTVGTAGQSARIGDHLAFRPTDRRARSMVPRALDTVGK